MTSDQHEWEKNPAPDSLPVATVVALLETVFAFTGNAERWRLLVRLRTIRDKSKHAPEIIHAAKVIHDEMVNCRGH